MYDTVIQSYSQVLYLENADWDVDLAQLYVCMYVCMILYSKLYVYVLDVTSGVVYVSAPWAMPPTRLVSEGQTRRAG